MVEIIRTDSKNADFRKLVAELDALLKIRDGNDSAFFAQHNTIDMIKHALVAFVEGQAVGCGSLKEFESGVVEIKRMYVLPEQRGKGIGTLILNELEKWSSELQYSKCILETGLKFPDAVALYRKNNYRVIPNYGPYINVPISVCFEKLL